MVQLPVSESDDSGFYREKLECLFSKAEEMFTIVNVVPFQQKAVRVNSGDILLATYFKRCGSFAS